MNMIGNFTSSDQKRANNIASWLKKMRQEARKFFSLTELSWLKQETVSPEAQTTSQEDSSESDEVRS